MKKILCLILALVCILTGICGCGSLNKQPMILADSISIPEDGIIGSAVFEALKDENKVVTFKGCSEDISYEWIIFGSDIKQAKNLNLGIEITEADSEKLSFRFLSEEDFGFSPALSIYLNDLWDAQSATLCKISAPYTSEKQEVSITGEKPTVLNFSPKVQTGAFIITPNIETDTAALSSSSDEPLTESTDTATSEAPESVRTQESSQPTRPSDSQAPKKTSVSVPSADSGRPISDGRNTEQDMYKTDPVPEGKPLPAEPEDQTVDTRKSYTCTLSIECTSILNHLSDLEPDKLDVLPKDGIIFAAQAVTFYEGESVYDVLKRVCRENKIHMEASWTPVYNSAYVEGIHNLYEFDCGSASGWMYRIDGWYPNYGCSRYQLKQGEKVEWRYTCDLGKDIGGSNAVGE